MSISDDVFFNITIIHALFWPFDQVLLLCRCIFIYLETSWYMNYIKLHWNINIRSISKCGYQHFKTCQHFSLIVLGALCRASCITTLGYCKPFQIMWSAFPTECVYFIDFVKWSCVLTNAYLSTFRNNLVDESNIRNSCQKYVHKIQKHN